MSRTRRSRRCKFPRPGVQPYDRHGVAKDGYHWCGCGRIMLFEPNKDSPPYCPDCSEVELSGCSRSLRPLDRLIRREQQREAVAGVIAFVEDFIQRTTCHSGKGVGV